MKTAILRHRFPEMDSATFTFLCYLGNVSLLLKQCMIVSVISDGAEAEREKSQASFQKI